MPCGSLVFFIIQYAIEQTKLSEQASHIVVISLLWCVPLASYVFLIYFLQWFRKESAHLICCPYPLSGGTEN